MQDDVIDVDGGRLYYRHTDLDASRPTVLFIHGLGESGLCFLEAFASEALAVFNIIVPDLPGFGRSSPAADQDYSFSKQIVRLLALLDELGVAETHLVGHSMGGDIGTLFCQRQGDRVLSFVNIEGNLMADNRYVVEQALQAEADGRFEEWLRDDFALQQVIGLCHRWPTTVRYLASLQMCRGRAFADSVHEIDALLAPSAGSNVALIGRAYRELTTPRYYCAGEASLAQNARRFLKDAGLRHRVFGESFHWVMLDRTVSFYRSLAEFIARAN